MRTIVALILLLSAPALANQEIAGKHYEKGMKLYAIQDWGGAVHEFEAGYREEPDPSFLFNIAQAHKMAGHAQQAIQFYERYLEKSPDASDRKEVMKELAALRQKAGGKGAAKVEPPAAKGTPPKGQPVAKVEPPATKVQPPVAKVQLPPPRVEPTPVKVEPPPVAPQAKEPLIVMPDFSAAQEEPPPPRRWPVVVGVVVAVLAIGAGVTVGAVVMTRPNEVVFPLENAR